jgi:transcriptional regulator with XRE-family HTH domain
MTDGLEGRMRDLGDFIRDQRRNARLSLRKLSEQAGISNPYLSQIERGLRKPSAEILQAIARALRISAETLSVKAGILEERTDAVDIASTLRRDSTLSQKQKQILLDLYQSFHAGAVSKAKRTSKPTTVRKVAAAKRTAAKRTTTKSSTRPASRGQKTRTTRGGRRTRRTA